MTSSDILATLALIISAGALALELRRWIEAGPQISLIVMADATMFPHDDGKDKLLVTATNRAGVATQITHMLVFAYPTPMHALFRFKPTFSAFVKEPGADFGSRLPMKIDVGDRWMGIMHYNEETRAARSQGVLYVGVQASHRRRDYLRRVPPAKPPPAPLAA